jgi:hypothetical protein
LSIPAKNWVLLTKIAHILVDLISKKAELQPCSLEETASLFYLSAVSTKLLSVGFSR